MYILFMSNYVTLTPSQKRVLKRIVSFGVPFQEYPGGFYAPESSAHRNMYGIRDFPFHVLDNMIRALTRKGMLKEFMKNGKRLFEPTSKGMGMASESLSESVKTFGEVEVKFTHEGKNAIAVVDLLTPGDFDGDEMIDAPDLEVSSAWYVDGDEEISLEEVDQKQIEKIIDLALDQLADPNFSPVLMGESTDEWGMPSLLLKESNE